MKKLIAIVLTLMLCLSVMSVAAFAAPEGLESLALVGTGIPGAADWTPSDAAGDMTEVSNNVYEKTVALAAGASMTFKVAGNDDWVDAFNFGNGAALVLGEAADLPISTFGGDMTLTVDKDMTVKITVDLTAFDGTAGATIKAEEVTAGGSTGGNNDSTTPTTAPTTQPTTTAGTQTGDPNKTCTLSVKVPSSWTKVYAYSWDANGAPTMGEWPGSEVKKNGDWYQGQITGVTKLIINNGASPAVQTQDLELEAGKDVWVVVGDDGKGTVTYTAPSGSTTGGNTSGGQAADPTPQGTLSNYRVVGNAAWMGNWDPASNMGQMVEVEPGVYKKNFENVEPGSYELKITKDGKWDIAYGDGNGGNYTFTVTEKCTITITFTLKDNVGVIHVKGTGVPATADVPMISVVVLLVLAATTTVVLVTNKKKFI